jgi:hypothetical protein
MLVVVVAVDIGGNLNLAQVVNSGWYYIVSSIRADWPWSLSPGSLASNGYNGYVCCYDCCYCIQPQPCVTHELCCLGIDTRSGIAKRGWYVVHGTAQTHCM